MHLARRTATVAIGSQAALALDGFLFDASTIALHNLFGARGLHHDLRAAVAGVLHFGSRLARDATYVFIVRRTVCCIRDDTAPQYAQDSSVYRPVKKEGTTQLRRVPLSSICRSAHCPARSSKIGHSGRSSLPIVAPQPLALCQFASSLRARLVVDALPLHSTPVA